ncbi:unnamed protein product [Effrenium voratum]|nr:unnamed protein product [Effrenium voratum]
MLKGVPILPLRQDVLLSSALFEEIEDGLTEDFLREYTGNYDLAEVKSLELQVDAVGAGQRVESLGELLPSLQQLRLSQSHLCTVRDLGTSLQHLKVLWLSRCSLQDLGGITALPLLEELYVSFNDVRDLSPLLAHEALQVLDLEGNLVEDFDEVTSLEAVSTLRELDLSDNPVMKQPGVSRESILEALPQIEVFGSASRQVQCNEEVVSDEEESEEEEVECSDAPGVAQLLLEVASECTPGGFVEGVDESSDRAIQELRRRAAQAARAPAQEFFIGEEEPDAAQQFYIGDEDTTSATKQSSQARDEVDLPSSAVATFRENAAKALCAPKPIQAGLEPSEQELVIESVKRSERSAGGAWTSRTSRSSRQVSSRRPTTGFRPTGFCPAKRPQAWGSSVSTSYGSDTLTSRSLVSTLMAEPEATSDLTAGDDGAALAGNALAAIRRRRRGAHERGEADLDIRGLLRRFEPGVNQEETPQVDEPGQRPATADVRITRRGTITSPLAPRAMSKQQSFAGLADLPRPKALGAAEILLLGE